jgi:4-hydroxy-3-polyprenylbenzoate decarboxylase
VTGDLTPRRLIVGMTGSTGAIYGVRLLQLLQPTDVETHLIVSKWGGRTLLHETPYGGADLEKLATAAYPIGDQGAPVSSGSFLTCGMVVVPCSMRTLAAIAHGHGDNLIHRAADVVLKERRKLVLVVREAPLSDIHLENMLKLSRMGAVISPPVPAFYHQPRTLEDVIDYTVVRILDQFDIHLDAAGRWDGEMLSGTRPASGAAATSKAGRRKKHDREHARRGRS